MIAINPYQDKNLQAVAESIAKEAGKLLIKLQKEPLEIHHKGVFDLVTNADKASNTFITEQLKAAFPHSLILAEEDPELMSALKEMDENELIWLVDPIDGTTNYAKHIPYSAVSIAAYRPKEQIPLMGVVYDPWRSECFTATLGQGAYLNGKPITVSSVSHLEEAVVCTGFGYDKKTNPDNNVAEFSHLAIQSLGIRRLGAASLDLAWVAMGRLDAYWEQNLRPWDIGAGMLLVSEAGGQVSTYNGESIHPFDGHILASNLALHHEMVSALSQARKAAGLSPCPLINYPETS